jgi:hypothetical protein
MKSLPIRVALTVAAVVAVIAFNHGCSNDSGSGLPAGPNSSRVSSPAFLAVGDCGADDYLTELSPVLESWEDSLEAWLGDGLLDAPPAYTQDSEPIPYLETLVPILQQWEPAINGELDSTVVDSVADFDPTTTSVPEYLVGLSDLLDQWKESLETFRETEFLATPPVFEPDTTAPVSICSADTTIDCADSSGVVVTFEATAIDDCDPSPEVTCEPPSGSTFGLGETLVTCTAADSAGNSSQCTFTVTVVAATPPVIECPPDTTVECNGADGTVFEFDVLATSECDSALTVICDPPSGSAFSLGETKVTCSATDKFGNTDECSFEVLVVDTTPPVIKGATPSPDRLWPPNHKMVDVVISVDIEEACDEAPHCYIVDVTSNESVNGRGDGNTEPDWMITGDLTVKFRAERAGGGSGRVYYIHLMCEDGAGNLTEYTAEVVVPHDQG